VSSATKETTVLIIDDEISIRESFSDSLEDKGYITLMAENGVEGLSLFRQNKPDLVLLDLNMPEMDGLEVLSEIQKTTTETPLIVISGTGEIHHVIEALRRGAWDFLVKPILDLEIFFHAVENALEKSRLRQENIKYREKLEQMVEQRTVELKQANHHLSQINSRLRHIVNSTRLLSFCHEVEQFGYLLLEEFGNLMQATGGSIYLRDEDGLRRVHTLDPGHAHQHIPFPLPEGSIFHRAINEKKPILVNNIHHSKRNSSSGWQGYQDGSFLVFPLPDGTGEIIGVLTLHSKKTPPFVNEDKEIGTILASYSCEAMRAVRITQELSISEERFRELAEMLPEAVFETDLKFNITYANQRAFEISGYTADDIKKGLNRNEMLRAKDQQTSSTTTAKQLSNELPGEGEHLIVRKDGSVCPILFRVNKIQKDGVIKGYRVIVIDITEQKKVAQKLENARNYISSIIDFMPSLIIGVDKENRVTLWNLAMEKATGVTAESAKGELVSDVFPQIAPDISKIGNSILTEKTITETNKPRQTESGVQYENITIYPLISDNEGAVIQIKNVTKEFEMQEQLNHSRKMDALGQLAGGIAHDFNNLIGGIMNSAQLLKSKKRNLDEKNIKFVDMIIKASRRAAELTEKLVAVGRKGIISPAGVDMHIIINDAVTLLERGIDKKVSISIESTAKNRIIIGDSSMIQSAIMNMCINSSHSMPDGGEITVSTKEMTLDAAYCNASVFNIEPGPYILIEISDTGCGIPLENLHKIFEPFFTTKSPNQGSGFGLAAVYGTIQDHNGAISVSSEVDKGTVFHLFLPLAKNAIVQQREEIEVLAGTGRILLVDDESIVRATGQAMLEEMGYDVLSAENGQEAVEIYQKEHHKIDLVILDIIMPVMDGRVTALNLREINHSCKIVFSSGFFKSGDLDDLKESGVSDYIRKPYHQSELSQTIVNILRR